MKKVILLFSFGEEATRTVRAAAGDLAFSDRVEIREVPKEEYGQKIGALCRIPGFPRGKEIYRGLPFPREMLLFSGFTSEELDSFLSAHKEKGGPPVPLKAIVTMHNISWTAEELYQELNKENMRFIKS